MDASVAYAAARDGNLSDLKRLCHRKSNYEVVELVSALTDEATPLLAACQNGHLNVVLYLLLKCHADVKQVGCVTVNGKRIKGAPPLWCAAAAGHLNLVKTLVKHKAWVDCNTQKYSTPLSTACFHGHFEIAKYLIKHGADLEVSNDEGQTCLMSACRKGHYAIAEYLLKSGAYANRRSVRGKTALHLCAESGNLEILKLLLRYEAVIYKDEFRCTPLLSAAIIGRTSVVEYFIRDEDCTKEDKVNALELLGATLIDNQDMASGIDCWRRAMKLRYEDAEDIPLEKPDRVSPITNYIGLTEVRTFYQLEELVDDPDKVRIQSLMVRYRILGPSHPDTALHLKQIGAMFAYNDNFKLCIRIWMCAFDVQRTFHGPLSAKTRHCLLDFVSLFSDMITEDWEVSMADVLNTIDVAIRDIQLALEYPEFPGQDLSKNTHFYRSVITVMHLVGIMCRLQPYLDDDELLKMRKVTYCFVTIDPIVKNDFTLLHLACLQDFPSLNRNLPFPSREVVELLLQVGACPNAVDCDKNTPLHIAAMHSVCDKHVIKTLLDHGAHLDVCNSETLTPLQLLRPNADQLDIYPLQHINLQCLSAQAIIEYKIPYEGLVHGELYEFIHSHSSY